MAGVEGGAFSTMVDYLALPASDTVWGAPYSTASVMAWVNANSIPSSSATQHGATIVSRTQNSGFAMRLLDGVLAVDWRVVVSQPTFLGALPVATGQWVHVAFRADGQTVSTRPCPLPLLSVSRSLCGSIAVLVVLTVVTAHPIRERTKGPVHTEGWVCHHRGCLYHDWHGAPRTRLLRDVSA